MQVILENCGEETLRLTPTAAIPLYGRSADNLRDHRHVTSLLNRVESRKEGVILTPTYSFDERGHTPNQRSYFVFGITEDGKSAEAVCADLDRYTGEGSLIMPEWVAKELPGDSLGGETAGKETIGALRFPETELRPGEKREYDILVGTAEDKAAAEQIAAVWLSPYRIRISLEETKLWWDQVNPIRTHTGDSDFDNILRWIGIQPTLRRIYGCSFLPHHDYGKGGRGWRDLWQDSLGLLLSEPETVADDLVAYFGGVRLDGTNATIIGNRPGEFKADRNGIQRVWMDHGYWPVLTIWQYIQQTGDIEILLRVAPFFQDGLGMRGTQRDAIQAKRSCTGTVAEHMLLEQLTAFCEAGEHGLLRLRDADWNDALDMAPQRGESGAFTSAYAGSMELLAKMLETLRQTGKCSSIDLPKRFEILLGEEDNWASIASRREKLNRFCAQCIQIPDDDRIQIPLDKIVRHLDLCADTLKAIIREKAWIQTEQDGWFNSYYDNYGTPLECGTPGQERMMLTGQVFAILGGVAAKSEIPQIYHAARRLLYARQAGGFRLNTRLNPEDFQIGRMLAFAYGHKENGAVFSHMSVMFAYALYSRGYAREGFSAIEPIWRLALDSEKSRIYPGIPEYFAPDGRGMYPYLTGSAAWMMLCVVQEMFGVRGENGALCLRPQLLPEQFDVRNRTSIILKFGGKAFKIVYTLLERLEPSEYTIVKAELDNMPIADGRILPSEMGALDKEKIHIVEAWLGRKVQ